MGPMSHEVKDQTSIFGHGSSSSLNANLAVCCNDYNEANMWYWRYFTIERTKFDSGWEPAFFLQRRSSIKICILGINGRYVVNRSGQYLHVHAQEVSSYT